MRILICLAVLMVSTRADAQQPPLARLADGATFGAKLTATGADGKLIFGKGEAARKIPLADLVRWGTPSDLPHDIRHGSLFLAAGGDRWVGEVIKTQGDRLRVDVYTAGKESEPHPVEASIPLSVLRAVLLHPSDSAIRVDRAVDRLLRAAPRQDEIHLDNGDRISGTFTGIAQGQIALQTKAAKVQIATENATALLFNSTLLRPPKRDGVQIMVGLASGTRLTAKRMTIAGGNAKLQLVAGPELTVKLSQIVWLQPLGGRANYLSDLTPQSYKHVPYLTLPWKYRTDRAVTGGALRIAGARYEKGLGMHSASRLTYRLSEAYARLDAELAVDAAAGNRGSVRYRVYIDDGSGKWKPRFASKIIRGGQAPTPMSVDIQGAKRISLLVDFADAGHQLDHANWLDARLVK